MNNEDMSELFSKFSNMINEGNIPDEMKNILSSLSNNNQENGKEERGSEQNSSDSGMQIDLETIMKMKTIMDKMKGSGSDPRANLLLSLKPYLKESRKEKIDQYIKLFGMSKVIEAFNSTGGEMKK